MPVRALGHRCVPHGYRKKMGPPVRARTCPSPLPSPHREERWGEGDARPLSARSDFLTNVFPDMAACKPFRRRLQVATLSYGTAICDLRSIQAGTGNPCARKNSGLNSLVW